MDDHSQNQELECRVCRVGGDLERPLFTPCKCTGSIGSVHQDCLEAWLNHSKKDTCELCGAKYEFAPQYSADTPKVISPLVFVKSIFKLTILKALPFTCRVLLALLIWLVLVPLGTTFAYCTCMRRNAPLAWLPTLVLKTGQLFESGAGWKSVLAQITKHMASTVCYGIVIDAVMALSMLIIVRLTIIMLVFLFNITFSPSS
jgi:E3 ubiquitin-protein ligase DOA10